MTRINHHRRAAIAAGLIRFNTGVPCKNGHFADRYVSSFACSQCLLEREVRLCAESPEYERKRKDGRAARQKERITKRKQSDPEWHKAYKEFLKTYRKDRLEREPEWAAKIYKNSRDWFKRNPEKARAYTAKRRALIEQSEEHHSADDIKELLELQKWKCAEPSCRKSLKKKYHVDHIMPITLGGHNGRSNIQCLCVRCNVRKSNKHPIEWAQLNGRMF